MAIDSIRPPGVAFGSPMPALMITRGRRVRCFVTFVMSLCHAPSYTLCVMLPIEWTACADGEPALRSVIRPCFIFTATSQTLTG